MEIRLPPDSLIAREKLTRYLLVHQPRGDKSSYLARGWCTIENADQLLHDLREQVRTRGATPLESTPFGQSYEIRGQLIGPSGRALGVRTIWMTERLSGQTKFITLIPSEGPEAA